METWFYPNLIFLMRKSYMSHMSDMDTNMQIHLNKL
jgi:hypothetical protein